jgi:hypothetical protein
MSEYTAQLHWQRAAHESFTDSRYSRRHRLRFDGGAEVPGSSSPQVVPLRPRVAFGGERQPDRGQLLALHHQAHESCYIANSVKSEVRCEPRL